MNTAQTPQELPTLNKEELSALFNRVHSRFLEYIEVFKENREVRRNRVNVKEMRENGVLQADQTYVAVRVIDENIMRDMPTYLAYLKQSTRIAIFKPADGSIGYNVSALEDWFTTQLCYSYPTAWEEDYIRWVDGALCHGRDYVEVVYDITRPGHVAVNHCGADRLIYDLTYDDIEQSPIVARGYCLSPMEVNESIKSKIFIESAGNNLLSRMTNNAGNGGATQQPAAINAYKVFTKVDKVVYFFWYSIDTKEFLTEPAPFFNGIQQKKTRTVQAVDPTTFSIIPQEEEYVERIPEQVYPFVALHKRITEDRDQRNSAGHAGDSYYLQEAATTMTTAMVNGTISAATPMWAPDNGNSNLGDTSVRQLQNFQVKRNAVWAQPMKVFTPPPPDPSVFNALQYLEARNGMATNNLAFAVANRKDSRKTATELSMAQNETSQVNSVQVLHLSIAVRQLCTRAWAIIQSEVLMKNIVPPAHIDPAMFALRYTILSAGDVDYVQRMQLIANMQQDWPILSQTPVGPLLLKDYLKARYPNDAHRYIAALDQQQQDTNLIQGLASVVQELATDDMGNPTQEALQNAQELQQLQQLVSARLGTGQVGGMAQPSGNAPAL